MKNIKDQFFGKLLTEPSVLGEKLAAIKAFVFDWDGVFNDGYKDAGGASPFSETDAMGINLLRFNHFLRTGKQAIIAVITGEKNPASFQLAKREHFHHVYFSVKHKVEAVEHIAKEFQMELNEIAFVFDDVLDLSAAAKAGLRFMVPQRGTHLLVRYAEEKGLVDYITHGSGGQHAVRESTELLLAVSGLYQETLEHRIAYSNKYLEYLEGRQAVITRFLSPGSPGFIESTDL